jgi:hypothetical protein
MAGYARPLIEGIRDYIPEERLHQFAFIPYDWESLVRDRQLSIYRAVEDGLHRKALRKLKHTMGSDVIWCGRAKNPSAKDFLVQMFNSIDGEIEELARGFPDFKVYAIGHSQGSQNLLEYCFDSRFKVSGLFTLGSIITARSGAYADWGHLPDGLEFWHNFYNKWDFVSSRIQSVHPSKQIAEFVVDHEVPLGLNPMNYTLLGAHCMYWKSSFVHKAIAEVLTGH